MGFWQEPVVIAVAVGIPSATVANPKLKMAKTPDHKLLLKINPVCWETSSEWAINRLVIA